MGGGGQKSQKIKMCKRQDRRKEIERCWQSSAVESDSVSDLPEHKKPLTLTKSIIAPLAHLTPRPSIHLLSPANK